MKLKIAVLAGDGIGPEVTREATTILQAVAEFGGHEFVFTPALIGGVAIIGLGIFIPISVTIDYIKKLARQKKESQRQT